ncbi:squalene--hopene cyclase [Paenibacillus montaniterrae]|uniref:Squalene--hopene cyclase n=1 Tax=Paenibacillus montaniterrae TaxID=429341 RepID=A0A920CW18_9BACL|nr:squalene--hopene cyclase [Paenibacillus montaniterrae]GIP14750.1 squalene--hopene cyclase [Paenibacillus montaniterrae]
METRVDQLQVQAAINQLSEFLIEQQQSDGTWRFCFENGTIIDAYMIILLRAVRYPDESIIRQLHQRIVNEQHQDGYWALYQDEENGNLAATIDNVLALLFSGYSQAEDEHIQRSKQYILTHGGITNTKGLLSKTILAITGQIPWPDSISSIPLQFMLLPSFSPINLFDFSGYSRVHLIPMLIMAKHSFHIQSPVQLHDLIVESANRHIDDHWTAEFHQMLDSIEAGRSRLIGSALHEIAQEKAEQFMLDRIEEDGTLYSYASCTILMVFSLLALGYDAQHPRIVKAVEGLLAMRGRSSNGDITIQNSPSTIWDTALISYALQQANVPMDHPAIRRANAYLLTQQQHKKGDWSIHNAHAAPGGWGFSETNTINPDLDDTTAALRAIYPASQLDNAYRVSTNLGLDWVLSMQNKDGGWPAFEKSVDNKMLTWLALDGAKAAAIDPSTADLTGRTLEYLGNYTTLDRQSPHIRRGVKWLLNNQEADGSWYGKWGICYLYGTWAALTGLMAVGLPANDKAVQKAAHWLLSIQNEDGGWGESCDSDRLMRYTPLHSSTPSQTAWALDALIAVNDKPTSAINKGIERLIAFHAEQSWQTVYPTGAGLPGNFYVHYHSYRYIYSLLALSHYERKFK